MTNPPSHATIPAMPLSDEHRATFTALVETLVPPANHPEGTTASLQSAIEGRLETDLAPELPLFLQWLTGLNSESFSVFSSEFSSLFPSTRDELLDRIESDNIRTNWQLEELGQTPTAYFKKIVDWLADEFEGRGETVAT